MVWVLRVFQSRKRSLMLLMLTFLKFVVSSGIHWTAKYIQAIETIQQTFYI